MSKTFETKKRILNLLKEGAKTPTDLSNTLGLSPSTISQHLKELKYSGRVEEYQDEHFHNIKHYAIPSISQSIPVISTTRAKYATFAFAILLIGALLVFFLNPTNPNTPKALLAGQPNSVSILLTDPPQAPSGTQALLVSYSSLNIQLTNNSGTFWESINSSGTVDLMSLVNFTRNLTSFVLPANSVADRISLNITNASINLNGTEYPVNVTQKQLSLKVLYTNSSSSAPFDILFDMYPTVSEVITGNQTEFVMIPYGTAATVPRPQNSNYVVGSGHAITRISSQEAYALFQARPSINITNAYINGSNGQMSVSLTVNDNSNKSTSLYSVIILGNDSYLLNLNFSEPTRAGTIYPKGASSIFAPPQIGSQVSGDAASSLGTSSAVSASGTSSGQINAPSIITYPNAGGEENSTASFKSKSPVPSAYGWGNGSISKSNATINAFLNGAIGGNLSTSAASNYTFEIRLNKSMITGSAADLSGSTVNDLLRSVISEDNSSANLSVNLTNTARLAKLVNNIDQDRYVTARQGIFRSINFLVTQNGTLELPGAAADFGHSNMGYNLSSRGSVTLKYSGSLALASGRVVLQPKPGQEYRIMVIGSDGAYAYASVKAG